MNRNNDNERSNPISRAFSKFFERGSVRDKDEPVKVNTAASPRNATASRTGTAAPVQRTAATPSAGAGLQTAASTTARPAAPPVTPTATPTATKRTHTVAKGDTLSGIAKQVYGDANKWRLIFEANRGTLDDPDRIYPGQVLTIPDAPQVH